MDEHDLIRLARRYVLDELDNDEINYILYHSTKEELDKFFEFVLQISAKRA